MIFFQTAVSDLRRCCFMHVLPGLLRPLQGNRRRSPRRCRESRPHLPAEHELRRRAPVRPGAVQELEEGLLKVFPSRCTLEKEFLAVFDGCLRQPIRTGIVGAGGLHRNVLPFAESKKLLAPELRPAVHPDHRREAKQLTPPRQGTHHRGGGGRREPLHKGVARIPVHHDEVALPTGVEQVQPHRLHGPGRRGRR